MSVPQVADHFIGRTHETEAFKNWLNDPRAPLLYIHDAVEEAERKGGVGKTWLLRHYAEIVEKTQPNAGYVMIDFFAIEDRDRIFMAEKIISGLQRLYPAWAPRAFRKTIAQYREQGGATSQEVRDRPEATLQELATVALAEDMRALAEHYERERKTLLLFFDTFELVEQNPTQVVLQPEQRFPDTYQYPFMRVVMAGRNRLNWDHPNWRGREEDVLSMALSPFSPQEMVAYIEAETVVSVRPEQVEPLYERTEGRPIMIGLVTDVLNHRIRTLDDLIKVPKSDFEGMLVQQVNQLENPINWFILFMAHVYHRFNLDILEWIVSHLPLQEQVQEISREQLTVKIPRLSFVRRASSGDDFVLHDEMRRLVTKYCWAQQDRDQRFRKDISACMIEYYEREIEQASSEQMRQACTIEMLHHQLFLDVAKGLQYFLRQHQRAIFRGRNGFARLLLQGAQVFLEQMLPAQRNDVQFAEARQLRAEDEHVAALEVLEELTAHVDPEWLALHEAELLREKGYCYRRQSRLRDAETSFLQSLELELARGNKSTAASLLSSLGEVCRRRGQFTQALDYYEQSLTLYRELVAQREDKTGVLLGYANVLTRMSSVYRVQGKIEEALRRCKIGWSLRLDLYKAGKISEQVVALSLNALGVIYHDGKNIVQAEEKFREAYEIYQRENDQAGIVAIYNRLGQVELAKGELDRAREWFEKARGSSQVIDAEQYINSLNKLGVVCLAQNKLDEAASLFEQAIFNARQSFDNYQQVESLIDLAEVFDRQQKTEQALRCLSDAEAIARRENYFSLLGTVEHERAEIAYKEGNYDEAFEHFVLCCHYMTNYNEVEYNIAVREIVDALLGVPREKVPDIVQKLRTYWKEHGLDEKYPALLQACAEMDDLTFSS